MTSTSRMGWSRPAVLLVVGALVAAPAATGKAGARPVHVERHPAVMARALEPAQSAPLPQVIGARLRVKQMVTVTSPSFGSTSGTLKAWRRLPNNEWQLARGPVRVVLGYGGWVRAAARRQSTGTTPAGRFRLPYAFGNAPDPGAQLAYRQVDATDWWPYEPRDPATYNIFQTRKARQTRWRSDYSEHLASYGAEYAYGLVVGFNLPTQVHYSQRRHQRVAGDRADTSRGGGIFFHVRGDGLTAGCVAMSRRQLRWLIRWVSPSAEPRLVMGPRSYVVPL